MEKKIYLENSGVQCWLAGTTQATATHNHTTINNHYLLFHVGHVRGIQNVT